MRACKVCRWCGEDFTTRTVFALNEHEDVHREMDAADERSAIDGLMRLFEMSAARTTIYHLGE